MAAKVIMVSHQKGGCGKSTISLNLGAALIKRGLRCVVLDIDSATSTSQRAQANYLNSIEGAATPPQRTLPEVIGFSSNSQPMKLEQEIFSVLRPLLDGQDVVVVDAAAGNGPQNTAAIQYADLVVVPAIASGYELQTTIDYLQDITGHLEMMRIRRRGNFNARVVFNRVENTPLMREAPQVLEESAPAIPQFRTRIPERRRLQSQMLTGSTVFDSNTDLANVFLSLADECLEVLGDDLQRRAA